MFLPVDDGERCMHSVQCQFALLSVYFLTLTNIKNQKISKISARQRL